MTDDSITRQNRAGNPLPEITEDDIRAEGFHGLIQMLPEVSDLERWAADSRWWSRDEQARASIASLLLDLDFVKDELMEWAKAKLAEIDEKRGRVRGAAND